MKIGDVLMRFGRDAFWKEGVPAFLNLFWNDVVGGGTRRQGGEGGA